MGTSVIGTVYKSASVEARKKLKVKTLKMRMAGRQWRELLMRRGRIDLNGGGEEAAVRSSVTGLVVTLRLKEEDGGVDVGGDQ